MEINLITHNPNKVREFKLILEPEIKVNHIDFEYPELRSDEPTEVVKIAAKSLCEKLNKPIVVEDSGFFIEKLNDFPGTCTAYIHKRIGNQGIIKLMKGIKNRKCFYKSAIGYCEPGKEPIGFLGIEEGKVALKILGNKGWGQDPIFIPKKSTKTYGQIRKEGDVNLFRKNSLLKLKKWLIEN
jgi:XTP/dITP diphosphohydrolase